MYCEVLLYRLKLTLYLRVCSCTNIVNDLEKQVRCYRNCQLNPIWKKIQQIFVESHITISLTTAAILSNDMQIQSNWHKVAPSSFCERHWKCLYSSAVFKEQTHTSTHGKTWYTIFARLFFGNGVLNEVVHITNVMLRTLWPRWSVWYVQYEEIRTKCVIFAIACRL